MKKLIFLFSLFVWAGAPVGAQPVQQVVGEVRASAARMSGKTLQKRFLLKPGDPFTPALFDKAQDDLHDLRVFKKLEFSTQEKNGKTDIFINAQDGYYIFPLAFASGGKKNAAALSLAAGNLFKQGESTFVFAGGSDDGFTAMAGLNLGDDFISLGFTKLNFDQRFYQNGWSNTFGVFSTTDDEDEYHSSLLGALHTRKEQLALTYMHRFSRTLRAFVRPEYVRYTYSPRALDNGSHNQITLGLRLSDDVRKGVNMGALSGYGLTDKKKSLQNLPRPRTGYAANVFYTAGGSWTGSDYEISKLGLEAAGLLEFKNRHMLVAEIRAQDAFKAPFSDRVLSSELLSGLGRYDRQIRGSRGAGAAVSFIYYLLRNETGLLSLAPFYELAYVYAGSRYRPHSGAGAALTYKLWRFPFPFGINYTRNLQDGSDTVGFVFGGKF